MNRLLTFITLLGLLLVGLTLGSAGLYWQENEAVKAFEHTQAILRAQLSFLAACQDVDMSSRGYAVTRNPDFALRMENSERNLQVLDRRLRKLIAGDAQASVRLGTRFDTALRNLIAASEAMKIPGREKDVLVQKSAMDTIRNILSGITDEETLQLEHRRQIARLRRNYIWVAIGIQLATGLGLLAAIGVVLVQYRQEAEDRIKALEEAGKQEQRGRQLAEEALESKSRFLATVSHEVRTPMAGIIGLTELLSLSDLGDDANSSVRAILDSSKRLLQILNNVLDAARLQAGAVQLEYREFPVRTLLGDVRQLITPEAGTKKLKVYAHSDNDIPEYVCGDELRVRQVLLNLAFNAVKFTQKGSISLKAELQQHSPEKVTVRFSVRDTGIGLSPEQQARLFQPFVQLQDSTTSIAGGAGLGLSICKNLVELMGGQIGIESEPGKGSTFWFDMPFSTGSGGP